jgi:hypothetical protein
VLALAARRGPAAEARALYREIAAPTEPPGAVAQTEPPGAVALRGGPCGEAGTAAYRRA